MGLDLYIKAKIIEKATGRCITVPNTNEINNYWFDTDAPNHEDYQYFSVLWMCGWSAVTVRNSWIDIINRYTNTSYSYDDFIIPFPQSALREMCSCLFSYSLLPEEFDELYDKSGFWNKKIFDMNIASSDINNNKQNEIQRYNREIEETSFLIKANEMKKFIYEIERVQYENKFTTLEADYNDGLLENGKWRLPYDFILLKKDRLKFKDNPQSYEWSFRMFNSY